MPSGKPSTGREVRAWASLKKPLLILVVAFFLYALFKSPDQAASIVRSAWDGIVEGLHAIGRFFDALLQSD
nr:hypothetical protein [Angustibacter aerolatus]